MLATVVNNCFSCCKNILPHQPKVYCCNCKYFYHTRCVYTNLDVTDWLCFNCTGDIFPFNHYADDDEFKFALFCFDNSLEYNRMLSLKLNPFLFDDQFRDIANDSGHLNDYHVSNICNYVFDNNDLTNVCNDDFSILHLNARSINRNFDSIHNFISNFNHTFSIITLSETWLNDDSPKLIDIDDYILLSAPRVGRRSGGVAIYVHNSLSYRIRDDLKLCPNVSDTPHSESLFIEIINPTSKNTIVGTVYRAHRTDIHLFLSDLDHCLNTMSSENKNCYISGDFNLDLLKYNTVNVIGDFLNTIQTNNLYPLIDRPTRITPTSATLIDNIFTNVLTHQIKSGVCVNYLTDHYPIFQITKSLPLGFHQPHTGITYTRSYNQKSVDNFHSHLNSIDWSFINNIDSAEDAYDAFTLKFRHIYDNHFPIKSHSNDSRNSRKRRISHKPWITTAILKSINRKDKLHRKYVSHPTLVNQTNLNSYRNKLTTLIRTSKKNYFTNKLDACKHNTKLTWNILNDILGRKTKRNLPSYFYDDNLALITDPSVIANKFNNYFVNVGPNLARKIQTTNLDHNHFLKNIDSPNNSLFFSPTDNDEIIKICNSFKSGTSSGFDDIKPDIVKSVCNIIAAPLTHIINLSLASGFVPTKLKIAKVIPIYKANDHHTVSNYRPISVLPVFSKIIERIVHNRLYDFISKFNLLHSSQFGFRSKRSSYMALMEAYNKIVTDLDSNNHTIGIFLDLSKAFDTINHDILLDKLFHYGIRGITFEWFRNYLSNRSQFVSINNAKSSSINSTCGVPQGSILGPLLFIIYLNDIVYSSKVFSFIIYADDTNLLASHKKNPHLIHVINQELACISNWLKANRLSLNINKSKYMIFKNKYSNRTYHDPVINIDNTTISKVACIKFLGVNLDESLTWKQHTTYIKNIVSKYSGILFRLKNMLPYSTLYSLYNSLVLPHVLYCNIIWADQNNCNLNCIHLKQKKIIRICSNSNFLAHTPPLFASLKSLTIYDIHKLHTAIFMYRSYNNLLPNNFSNYFIKINRIHPYTVRTSNNFRPPNFNTNLARNSIRSQGPILWNKISSNIKNSTSFLTFKYKYKQYLLSQY